MQCLARRVLLKIGVMQAFPKPLSNPLQQLTVFSQHYNAPMLSDIILAAEDQQIYAHKVVLASHSASFKAMFEVRVWFCMMINRPCQLTSQFL